MKTSTVKLVTAISLACILCSGCQRLMRDLQYSNVETRLFPMSMDLSIGGGKTDAAKLISTVDYVGEIQVNGFTVRYPEGMALVAADVAAAFDKTAVEVQTLTSIPWAFDVNTSLVPVSDTTGGYRLSIPLRSPRELKLPLLMTPGREPSILPAWSRGIAHEITEASMLAPLSRNDLILGDYCIDGAGLVNETRWFRDGVSEYVGDMLNRNLFGERYQPPKWIYDDLARIGPDILCWDNCEGKIGPDAYYNASLALVRLLVHLSGGDAIARIMQAASEDSYINGGTLGRAVAKATGIDLKEFLEDYRPVWLGMDLRDTRAEGALLVKEGNEVVVSRVYPGYPADKWKLRPGDVILAADGHEVVSSAWLTHYIAALNPRDRIRIDVERAGERRSYNMMVIGKDVGY